MNVAMQWKDSMKKWTRRLAMPAMALALIAAFATYECVKPSAASAANASPSAAPLDVDSVSSLLAVDKAMETLAARVTPAVVNVTVTSRAKAEKAGQQMPEDMQQFSARATRLASSDRICVNANRRSNTAWAAAS